MMGKTQIAILAANTQETTVMRPVKGATIQDKARVEGRAKAVISHNVLLNNDMEVQSHQASVADLTIFPAGLFNKKGDPQRLLNIVPLNMWVALHAGNVAAVFRLDLDDIAHIHEQRHFDR